MSYTAAGGVALVVCLLLSIVGALDVWCTVWRTPKNRTPVHSGKSPAPTTRYPR